MDTDSDLFAVLLSQFEMSVMLPEMSPMLPKWRPVLSEVSLILPEARGVPLESDFLVSYQLQMSLMRR
jgi:hypothetical protein